MDVGPNSEEEASFEAEEDGSEDKGDSDDAPCEEETLLALWQEANNRMPVSERTDRNFLFMNDAPCDG